MKFDPRSLAAALRDGSDGRLGHIEDATLNAAQPPEQLLLDGWLLRLSPSKARRARSINAIAAGRISLEQKLALCRDWYSRSGLPLLFRVTPFSQPPALDDFLATQGFDAFDETRVMVRRLEAGVADAGAQSPSLRAHETDSETFAARVGELRGSPAVQVRAHAGRLRALPLLQSVRLLLEDQGSLVAAGQIVIEGEFAGLYDLVTAPEVRGRGHGRALSRLLLVAAAAQGARTAYLQVDAANAPARRIYAGLGFEDRYAYWYRWPSGTTDEIPSPGRPQEQST